jgi:hypothetical protein
MRHFPFLFIIIFLANCPVLLVEKLQAQTGTSTTILLVDDSHILYRSGTKRSLNQLIRYKNNPVILQTKPWETTISYCSVHHDAKTGKFRLWYQAYHQNGNHLAYATSEDGINWEKPSLNIIDFNGNKDNNLVLHIGYGGSVLFDPFDKDTARRYKCVFWEGVKKSTRTSIASSPAGLSIAFSPDGIHWTKYKSNPVIKGSYGPYIQPPYEDEEIINSGDLGAPLSTSDVADLIWDPQRKVFAVYAKTWLDGPTGLMHWKRAVVRSESLDFINWSKPVLVMATDEFDVQLNEQELAYNAVGGGSVGNQFHSGPSFYYNNMYFSMLQAMDAGGTGNMPIELAISKDGYNWDRPFRSNLFLSALEDKKRFDASLIWSNATPIFLKDTIRFYYGAYSNRWNDMKPYENTISGIGYATIPRDRFAGVKPIGTIGQITFKEINLENCQVILLNADATNGGIKVEILNEDGYRVRGFSKDDAVMIQGDSLRHQVAWENKKISDLPAGRYRIRLHLENAEVFALTFKR